MIVWFEFPRKRLSKSKIVVNIINEFINVTLLRLKTRRKYIAGNFLPAKAKRTEIKWDGGRLPGFSGGAFLELSLHYFNWPRSTPLCRSLEVSFTRLRIPFNDFILLGRDIRFRFTFYSRSSRFLPTICLAI